MGYPKGKQPCYSWLLAACQVEVGVYCAPVASFHPSLVELASSFCLSRFSARGARGFPRASGAVCVVPWLCLFLQHLPPSIAYGCCLCATSRMLHIYDCCSERCALPRPRSRCGRPPQSSAYIPCLDSMMLLYVSRPAFLVGVCLSSFPVVLSHSHCFPTAAPFEAPLWCDKGPCKGSLLRGHATVPTQGNRIKVLAKAMNNQSYVHQQGTGDPLQP